MKLADASKNFKRGVKITIGLVVIYYLSVFLFIPVGKKLRLALFPLKDLPNVLYGKLDPLIFITKPVTIDKANFILNTKTGRLPSDFPNKFIVYKFKDLGFSYEAGKSALNDANFLGFADKDLITDLKGNIYKWRSVISNGILTIKIYTKEIVLNTPLIGKEAFYPAGRLTQTSASDLAKNVFRTIHRFDSLYESGRQVVHLGKFYGDNLIESKEVYTAQIASVDLFRDINKVAILGPDPQVGLLHIYLKKPDSGNSLYNYPVVLAYYWEIDQTPKATYPLLPLDLAWKAVADGKGYVVNVTPKDSNPFAEPVDISINKVLINNIFLAYYETPEFQSYLQPIYVFEGNYLGSKGSSGNISFYLPAITSEYVKQNTEISH